MKAKARESKTKENVRYLTGGGPSVVDMDPVDAKVMDIDKNILTNVEVDIDSDINGTVIIVGDSNNEAWAKPNNKIEEEPKEKEQLMVTPRKIRNTGDKMNRIDYLKCQILEEELDHKRKMHEEELKMKMSEREYKERLQNIELEIKLKILKSFDK